MVFTQISILRSSKHAVFVIKYCTERFLNSHLSNTIRYQLTSQTRIIIRRKYQLAIIQKHISPIQSYKIYCSGFGTWVITFPIFCFCLDPRRRPKMVIHIEHIVPTRTTLHYKTNQLKNRLIRSIIDKMVKTWHSNYKSQVYKLTMCCVRASRFFCVFEFISLHLIQRLNECVGLFFEKV